MQWQCTPNQKAKTVTKCLWEKVIFHYGIREMFHSAQEIKELCNLAGNHQVKTTLYQTLETDLIRHFSMGFVHNKTNEHKSLA